eukprot:12414-Heterococcus_DN1.PRE.1
MSVGNSAQSAAWYSGSWNTVGLPAAPGVKAMICRLCTDPHAQRAAAVLGALSQLALQWHSP